MATYIIDFSPTGGTRKVMEMLVCGWNKEDEAANQEIKKIDLTSPTEDFSVYHFEKEDVCFIGMPSYGGRAPQTALNRLKKMKGNGANAVIVAVYGNRDIDDTLLEMKEETESYGFSVKAAVAAVAEHSIMRQYGAGRPDEEDREELMAFGEKIQEETESYGFSVKAAVAAVAEHSIMRQYGAGRPDEEDREELMAFGEKIRQTIFEKTEETNLQVPGNKPYKEYNGIPLKPKGGKECIQCGRCVLQCPVQAIPLSDPRETDGSKCISCMRCIAICPNKARKLNPVLLFASSKKMEKALSGRKKNYIYL